MARSLSVFTECMSAMHPAFQPHSPCMTINRLPTGPFIMLSGTHAQCLPATCLLITILIGSRGCQGRLTRIPRNGMFLWDWTLHLARSRLETGTGPSPANMEPLPRSRETMGQKFTMVTPCSRR